mmetsp:Transcript_29565/g.61805  ORF Transcript_29565/g.61805 Transcript_29565/m.61805 type:complete len:202 (+) Transcript_29565:6117-6722(+)
MVFKTFQKILRNISQKRQVILDHHKWYCLKAWLLLAHLGKGMQHIIAGCHFKHAHSPLSSSQRWRQLEFTEQPPGKAPIDYQGQEGNAARQSDHSRSHGSLVFIGGFLPNGSIQGERQGNAHSAAQTRESKEGHFFPIGRQSQALNNGIKGHDLYTSNQHDHDVQCQQTQPFAISKLDPSVRVGNNFSKKGSSQGEQECIE